MNDIKLTDADAGVAIVNGDFCVADSTTQHQELLLVSSKGEWKEHPDRGVGIATFLEGYAPNSVASAIQEEFTRDGMRVRGIKVNNTKIDIDAEYRG